MSRIILLLSTIGLFLFVRTTAQQPSGPNLEKMPAALETDLALSALPLNLRTAATVYLLDPAKGYYVGQQGSNGFVCFIDRTDWEWGKFRNDVFAPIAYDPEGAKTIFPVYRDVAAMRASGKWSALQIKDSVIKRFHKGIYRAPAKGGLSYMLAPIMRVYAGKPGDETVMTMNMPHYMFYAPYSTDQDVGMDPNSPDGPWLANSGNTVLCDHKGPHGYFIVPANEAAKAKIMADGMELLHRLAEYSPYFKIDEGAMHH